ncbi:hypothetical protein MCEGEM3_01509 [Oxalobacteraceae bacterium]
MKCSTGVTMKTLSLTSETGAGALANAGPVARTMVRSAC